MNEKHETLRLLENISFHDVPVEKISFKTIYSTDFIVDFGLYNEEKEDYDYWTMKFIGIQEMDEIKLSLNSRSDLEITSFDYQWNDLFEGEIYFLTGVSEPSFVVKVKSQQFECAKTFVEK